MNTKRVQNWDDSVAIGERAVREVTEFLLSDFVKNNWYPTQLVHNVENEKIYRSFDIDLLWVVPVESFLRCYTVEVKGDQLHQFGNFFFETVSIKHRNTPGAFVISQAEWLFYYFVHIRELYCLPMGVTKTWFLENETRFKEATAHSQRNSRSWSTVGRKVPIQNVIDEVKGVRKFKYEVGLWRAA